MGNFIEELYYGNISPSDRDIIKGGTYSHILNLVTRNEDEVLQARSAALNEMVSRAAAMGANAVVGVDVDYETLGQGNMLMVTAAGTAVIVD